jgi:hypothetical protein
MLLMAAFPAVILAALFLENNDLGGACLPDDGGLNAGARDHGGADGGFFTIINIKNFVNFKAIALISIDFFDQNLVVFFNFVLFAACADYCEHINHPCFEKSRFYKNRQFFNIKWLFKEGDLILKFACLSRKGKNNVFTQ